MGSSSGKVYVFNGTDEGTLYEIGSIRDFTVSLGTSMAKTMKLPSPWQGSGHTVYNNHTYYLKEGKEPRLVKYDLWQTTLSSLSRTTFPYMA